MRQIQVADDSGFMHTHDASPEVMPCECSTYTFQRLEV